MRNYLDNQTALSTVEISLMEDRVIMPEVGTKGFDTGEKTKKQFLTSIHFLLAFGSGLIVFVIGNLPILLIIVGIGGVVYFLIRSKIKREKRNNLTSQTMNNDIEKRPENTFPDVHHYN